MQAFEKLNALELLKQEIEEVFGRPITSYRECVLLSDEIYNKTSFLVSHNTLRRFFGLVKAVYPPSTSTITILTQYCGYSSLQELVAKKQKLSNNDQNNPSYNVPDYIISFIRDTPVREPYDPTFAALVKQTLVFLQDYPALSLVLQKDIAKIKNGQDYYFEQFININALGNYYGEGLRYYLNEKRIDKAQIFGHSLLCLRAWLTGNTEDVKKHYEDIVKHRVHKCLPPFTSYMYYVSLLLYANVEGLNTDKIIEDACRVDPSYVTDKNVEFPWTQYLFAVTLLLTGKYDELLYFFNIVDIDNKKQSDIIDDGYFESNLVFSAIALARTGELEQAKKIYEQVRPSRFYFLTRKLDTILYIILAYLLNKENDKMEIQFNKLIEDTCFSMLAVIKRNLFKQKNYLFSQDTGKVQEFQHVGKG
mgnify:CR=1 FL=1|jgi:hypothetical protein